MKNKYRRRTLEYREEGHSLAQTSKVFKVAINTIRNWEKQLKTEGHLQKHTFVSAFKKIAPEKLRAYVKHHPDAYLREIAEAFRCCQTAIRKALKQLKITRKKKTTRYFEQDSQKVKEYLEKIKYFSKEKIVYIDETGIDKFLYRKYARALKGEKIYERVRGNKFERTSIVAAQKENKL